jgi:hypothetical protein
MLLAALEISASLEWIVRVKQLLKQEVVIIKYLLLTRFSVPHQNFLDDKFHRVPTIYSLLANKRLSSADFLNPIIMNSIGLSINPLRLSLLPVTDGGLVVVVGHIESGYKEINKAS